MRPIVQEYSTGHSPEALAAGFAAESGAVLLRSHGDSGFDLAQARYSFLAADPFLVFRSFGSQIGMRSTLKGGQQTCTFGDPWHVLDSLLARYELLDQVDLPFPLGACFGYWGYGLKNFVEPRLARHSIDDLELPDCWAGFYDSLVVFDHVLGKTWVVSTGLRADGSRDADFARRRIEFWTEILSAGVPHPSRLRVYGASSRRPEDDETSPELAGEDACVTISNLSRDQFLERVQRAQRYIEHGEIYQVNLSQRLATRSRMPAWQLYERLSAISPAPFSAYLNCGDFQIVSSSPEQFLRLSGTHIQTRPIKGTRPRSPDPTRDAQLAFELQTSSKETAELVMITDLLRNDLGRVCEYGSVQVPELARLARFAHVQHLVSMVEGRLRQDVTHLSALGQCFPGGSVTGAPKIRAMEIIDELEPIARGPYTGCLGYLGFNRESQLSIIIRTALCKGARKYFHVGAGIVADSIPEAEYEETLAKAAGFVAALKSGHFATASPLPRARVVRKSR